MIVMLVFDTGFCKLASSCPVKETRSSNIKSILNDLSPSPQASKSPGMGKHGVDGATPEWILWKFAGHWPGQ